MVKIDVEENEAKAYMELLKDAKMSPEMGYILTMLKYKIFAAFKKDGDVKNKEMAKKMLEEEVELKKPKGKGKK